MHKNGMKKFNAIKKWGLTKLQEIVLMSIFILSILITPIVFGQDEKKPAYLNPNLSIEERVNDLLSRMTLEEKIEQLSGDETGFSTKPNERLGIPGIKCTDGPVGVRWRRATAFPVSILIGSSWDLDLMERVAIAIAKETKAKGRNQLLGPCINIIRDPRGGRSAETYGEDPYLISKMAVAYIKGIQSQKVIATPKHYACNNQENGRGTNDVKIDERVLREFYLPHFQVSIQEANAWSVMAAYNKVNGSYCAENKHLLRDILKDEWGFKGFVISDWGACHSTVASANNGLDLEMPQTNYYGEPLLDAVKAGLVSEETINDSVRRILRAKFWAGLFDEQPKMDRKIINCKEHQELALEAAKAGIVLLKNEKNILPLDRNKIKKIAVIGPNAGVAQTGLGGSAKVEPFYAISVLDGIKIKVEDKIEIKYAKGCDIDTSVYSILPNFLIPHNAKEDEYGLKGEYFNNVDLRGKPALVRIDKQINFNLMNASPSPAINKDNFSVRWTGKLVPTSEVRYLSVTTDDGVRLYLDNKLLIDDWNDHAVKTNTVPVKLKPHHSYDIRIEYYERSGFSVAKLEWDDHSFRESMNEAVNIAKKSDVAIVAVGLSSDIETEGRDRDYLNLPEIQEDLIKKISAVNKNTVVVLIGGICITMQDWIDKVPSLLVAWYPGEQGGNAIADILFGDYNPSGKLPITFPKSIKQLPPFDNNYETADTCRGYRYFDKYKIEPQFPFGYGLSYTKFDYSNLKIEPKKMQVFEKVEVTVDVKNIGKYEGNEVVQLYVRDIVSSVDRPIKELKGFKKINLKLGEKKTVTFTLTEKELSFYDVNQKKFVVEPGKFEVMIGASSRDIRLKDSFEVK